MSRRTPRSRSHPQALGALTKLAVLGLLSALFVLAPAPHVEAVETMVVDTRTPVLRPAPTTSALSSASPNADTTADTTAELRAPGRQRAAEEPGRFDMLGLTVPVGTTGDLLARARTQGVWSPWAHIEVNPEHRPEGRERATGGQRAPGLHSEPVWFGDADAYELSVPAGVTGVQVHLVRSQVESLTVTAVTPSATAATTAAGGPAILTRAQWGARPPTITPSVAPDLKIAVVHHSVNANTYSREDVPSLLRGIQTYHMDVQGWNDIAYNFAVDRFGRIWEARAGGITKAVIGGHAQGFNTYSTGVMVLGDFTSAQPSQAAVDAVAEVVGWKFALHQVEVRGTTQFASLGGPKYAAGTVVQLPRIVGHRDVGQTGCPGSELYRRLGEIRTKAASRFDAYLAQQPETPLFGDFDGNGLRDVLRYRPGATSDVLWSHPGTVNVPVPVSMSGTYRPVVADLDGDRRDDILWYAPGSTPADQVWYGGAVGFTVKGADIQEQGLPQVAELDGDGIDDVVVYAPGGSPDRIYSGRTNRTLVALPLSIDNTFDLSVGDFDGDGRDDLFWYGYGVNPDSMAFSAGNGGFVGVATPTGTRSSVPVVGDFDGNGQDDIVLYGPGDAPDALWWSEPGPRSAHTVEPLRVRGTSYRPQVGDVTGDGRDELLWYQPGTGGDPMWSWDRARVRSERVLSVGGTFVPDLGRYTNDAMDDIAWMSPTSASYLWVATGGGSFRSVALG